MDHFDQTLPHGISLSCRAVGSPHASQRVVLLHGFPEAAFAWDEVMAGLASVARCIAPNLRGYERSSTPTGVEAYRAKHLALCALAMDAKRDPKPRRAGLRATRGLWRTDQAL